MDVCIAAVDRAIMCAVHFALVNSTTGVPVTNYTTTGAPCIFVTQSMYYTYVYQAGTLASVACRRIVSLWGCSVVCADYCTFVTK